MHLPPGVLLQYRAVGTKKMNNLIAIFLSLLIAVYCGAYPHISLQSQHDPLRIVNGTDAEEGEFPYMVQLFSSGDFMCGGSIIGEKWILTAGHCVYAGIDYIVYGTNELNELNSVGTKVKVNNSYLHPHYSYNYIPKYDVGVLELEETIPFSDKAQPLKLADSNDVPFHIPGILAGWGYNTTYGNVAQNLRKITLKLLNDTECTHAINTYAESDIFDSVHDLCSDDYWNGECYGDSGSPFVIDGLVYGVVSWSIKPCGSNPGTYSRITNPEYREFIKNITGF